MKFGSRRVSEEIEYEVILVWKKSRHFEWQRERYGFYAQRARGRCADVLLQTSQVSRVAIRQKPGREICTIGVTSWLHHYTLALALQRRNAQ